MLEVIKDDDGNILAACEYRIVDRYGRTKEDGKYLWIANLEVAKNYWNEGVIKYLIRGLAWKTYGVDFVYWMRGKYKKRIRIHLRNRLIQYANK